MSSAELIEPGTDGPAARQWSEKQDIALRLWARLSRCYATCSRAMAAQVQGYELTTPQFVVLEALHHLGPLPLGELAEKLLVTGGNVTYVMDRLESRGLVTRDRRTDDRRVVVARMTTEGRDLVSKVFPDHVGRMEHLSRHLTDQEQRELSALLKKLGTGIFEHDLSI